MLISEIFKHKHCAGDIGLEVEVQGDGLPRINNMFWSTQEDGSLKGKGEGLEYVLKTPLKMDALYPVLAEWKKAFVGSRVYPSYHAGIHVHANLQSFTPKQVINLLVALIILEDLLVKWCGPTREGNHFCLRTSDTDYLINFIREMILDGSFEKLKVGKLGGEYGGGKGNDDIRYSSYNLKSLYQYGSLEFRTMASTMDIDRIHTWCAVLHNIVQESKKYDSPSSVVTEVSVGGYENFLHRMLGPYKKTFITDNYVGLLREGVIRAQDIAFCKDWNSLNVNIFKGVGGLF